MKFIHRLGYYFGGFAIGLIILAFFLSGKKTSCSYSPNARTTKNISQKQKIYSDEALKIMSTFQLDTTAVADMIKFGKVDFSKSDTHSEDCKTYTIENSYKQQEFILTVMNCDSIATIKSILTNKNN